MNHSTIIKEEPKKEESYAFQTIIKQENMNDGYTSWFGTIGRVKLENFKEEEVCIKTEDGEDELEEELMFISSLTTCGINTAMQNRILEAVDKIRRIFQRNQDGHEVLSQSDYTSRLCSQDLKYSDDKEENTIKIDIEELTEIQDINMSRQKKTQFKDTCRQPRPVQGNSYNTSYNVNKECCRSYKKKPRPWLMTPVIKKLRKKRNKAKRLYKKCTCDGDRKTNLRNKYLERVRIYNQATRKEKKIWTQRAKSQQLN